MNVAFASIRFIKICIRDVCYFAAVLNDKFVRPLFRVVSKSEQIMIGRRERVVYF
jgi:hypothetical protein